VVLPFEVTPRHFPYQSIRWHDHEGNNWFQFHWCFITWDSEHIAFIWEDRPRNAHFFMMYKIFSVDKVAVSKCDRLSPPMKHSRNMHSLSYQVPLCSLVGHNRERHHFSLILLYTNYWSTSTIWRFMSREWHCEKGKKVIIRK
jgi:hypothetical protein